MRFRIRFGECGRYARAITEDGVDVIHLYEGSVTTEGNVRRIVDLLNAEEGNRVSDSKRLDDYAEARFGLLLAINRVGFNFDRGYDPGRIITRAIDFDADECPECGANDAEDLGDAFEHYDGCAVVRPLNRIAALDRLCPEEAAEGRRFRGEVT